MSLIVEEFRENLCSQTAQIFAKLLLRVVNEILPHISYISCQIWMLFVKGDTRKNLLNGDCGCLDSVRMEGCTFDMGVKEVTFLHAPWNRIEI